VRVKDLIKELARRFDEEGRCEKSEISTKIKEILADKIKEHKITVKWIEQCLPQEYKRPYRFKSELSSLLEKENSKVKDSNVTATIDNKDGSLLLIKGDKGHSNFSDDNEENTATDIANPRGSEIQENETSIDSSDHYQMLQEENRQLKEAFAKQTRMMIASQIQPTEMEFMIPSEKYYRIKEVMNESKHVIYITFDNKGIMIKVVADIFKTH
jgi:hypothetical protein